MIQEKIKEVGRELIVKEKLSSFEWLAKKFRTRYKTSVLK
jgi:hypothetical protein